MDIYYVYQVIIMSMQIDLLNVLDLVLDFIIKGIIFFLLDGVVYYWNCIVEMIGLCFVVY